MADMRLIVAGAGGRMGRTLIKAIAETDGRHARGRGRCAGLAVIGRDAGELAGLGRQRHHRSPPSRGRCSPRRTASSISPFRRRARRLPR